MTSNLPAVQNEKIVPGIGAMDETDNTSLSNFAQLMQKTSKKLEEDTKLKIGDIVDMNGVKLNGKSFIPVFKFNVFTKFAPIDEGGGVEWRTTNCKDQRVVEGLVWKKDKKGNTIKPEVSKSGNLIVAFDGDFDNLVIIPFRSTSLKTLNLLMKQAISDGSLYFRTYSVGSEKKEAKGFTYQVMTVQVGKPIDKKLLAQAEKVYNQQSSDYTRMSAFIENEELPGIDDAHEELKSGKMNKNVKKGVRPF